MENLGNTHVPGTANMKRKLGQLIAKQINLKNNKM
jgi:hypothetical protein